MRIIALTILFVLPMYYFGRDESPAPMPEADSIKVSSSAPDRIEIKERTERLLTVEEPIVETKEIVVDSEVDRAPSEEEYPEEVGAEVSDLEHAEDVQINDVEMAWNNELGSMLTRLEPMEGEAIHRSYMQAQETYQAELNALMDEKQQKGSDAEVLEIEHMIGQLDYSHQENLKNILGAHYEAVRDHYQYYMDTLSAEE